MNVIIDGSYVGHRSLHVAKFSSTGSRFLDSDEDKINFVKKLKVDFLYELRKMEQYGTINRIIFATDSKSWRKEHNKKYKASRAKVKQEDEKINWNVYYDIMNKFIEYLTTEFGVIKSYVNTAEADDLIYFWSKYFLSKNQNSIIITVDKDLYQVVDINENNNFTVVYNNHAANRHIIITEKLNQYIKSLSNEVGLYSENDELIDDINILKGMTSDNVIFKLNNTEELLIDKIFTGDKSDEIGNVLEKVVPNRATPIKVRRPDITKLLKKFTDEGKKYIFANAHKDDELLTECSKFFGSIYKLDENEIIQLKERILENSKLIILSDEVIPKTIKKGFVNSLKELAKNKKTLKIRSLIDSTNKQFFENVLGLSEVEDETDNIEIYFEL